MKVVLKIILLMVLAPCAFGGFTFGIWPATNCSPRMVITNGYVAKDFWAIDCSESVYEKQTAITNAWPLSNVNLRVDYPMSFFRYERENLIKIKQFVYKYAYAFVDPFWPDQLGYLRTNNVFKTCTPVELVMAVFETNEEAAIDWFYQTPWREIGADPFLGWDGARAVLTNLHTVQLSASALGGTQQTWSVSNWSWWKYEAPEAFGGTNIEGSVGPDEQWNLTGTYSGDLVMCSIGGDYSHSWNDGPFDYPSEGFKNWWDIVSSSAQKYLTLDFYVVFQTGRFDVPVEVEYWCNASWVDAQANTEVCIDHACLGEPENIQCETLAPLKPTYPTNWWQSSAVPTYFDSNTLLSGHDNISYLPTLSKYAQLSRTCENWPAGTTHAVSWNARETMSQIYVSIMKVRCYFNY